MQFSTQMTISTAFALLACGAAHPATIAPAQRDALNACVVRAAEALRFNGSVYLGQPGDAVVSRNFGAADAEGKVPVTDQTRFNIASAGKMFTAVGIGMLAERGEVDWDTSIGRYLPGLDAQLTAITIRELPAPSGLGDYLTPDNLRRSTKRRLRRTCCRSWSRYRQRLRLIEHGLLGIRHVVLGAIIEKLTGWHISILFSGIATPLGMADTRAILGAAEPMTRLSPTASCRPAALSPMHPQASPPAACSAQRPTWQFSPRRWRLTDCEGGNPRGAVPAAPSPAGARGSQWRRARCERRDLVLPGERMAADCAGKR
jgi:CubicO group peptidase (beta-lactamase class C family)